jgi:anti-anti-sigma regulatory factor
MRFSLTRRQRDDRVDTLTRAGEVDLRTAGAPRAATQDTLRTPHPADIVDLGRATFLDCAGIGELPAGRNTAVRRGRGYTVVNPQRHVRRFPEITDVLGAPAQRVDSAQRTGQAAQSRRSLRRRNDRQVAAGPPPPSTADVSASQTNASW